jgi:hypothetical protein
MSAFGTKQTWASAPHMSAFGVTADKYERHGISCAACRLSQDQAAPLWQSAHKEAKYFLQGDTPCNADDDGLPKGRSAPVITIAVAAYLIVIAMLALH